RVTSESLSARSVFVDGPARAGIYTLSLHDALPICADRACRTAETGDTPRTPICARGDRGCCTLGEAKRQSRIPTHASNLTTGMSDRKSTRLNSSHVKISYAVFCLKKKQTQTAEPRP